jgi:UDP-GlcNAc:undecaprenyl-phosphate GlcNAc-1-phosphate transferase
MLSLLLLAGVAFVCAWLLTPMTIALCRWAGWLDQPDRQRKLHHAAVPRMGGLVLAVSYVLSFGVLLAMPGSFGEDMLRPHLATVWALAPATVIVLAVGLLDDLHGLSPRFKLIFECAAALLVVAAGLSFGDAWWSAPATVLWLVATANAFNLIDGVDGLAAGVGLFATVAMLAAALLNGNYGLALATAPLAGALLGFLRYNFEPASIFLGDGGSLTVGFLLGCFALLWGYKSTAAVGMTAPLILLFLPFLDVALSIARRFLSMKPIFGADRGHIHHRLLALGLRPRHVAMIAYAACGLAAGVSMFQSSAPPLYGAIVVAAFALLVWLAIAKLRYAEFRATYRALWTGQIRRVFRQEILLDQLRHDLAEASSVEECWDHLCATSKQLGLEQVYLRLGNSDRLVQLRQPDAGAPVQTTLFQTTVPLREGEYVAFTGQATDPATAQLLLPMAEALKEALKRQHGASRVPLPRTGRSLDVAPRA